MNKLINLLKTTNKDRIFQFVLVLVLLAVIITPARNNLMSVLTEYEAVTVSSSSGKKLPIYCVDSKDKKVAISFDAAWGADDTDSLLQTLKENDVKATFFLCGYWVDKYPEEVKRIYADGHDIGNHGNTHAHSASLSVEKNKQEIMAVHEKVKALLGVEMNLFRPPFGEYNNNVIQAADECSYYTIQWDIDSHDWMNKGADYEINRVLNHKHMGNGSIVLFHNGAKDTPKTLPIIIKGLKEKGFEFVPISELIIKDNYKIDHEGRQIPLNNN